MRFKWQVPDRHGIGVDRIGDKRSEVRGRVFTRASIGAWKLNSPIRNRLDITPEGVWVAIVWVTPGRWSEPMVLDTRSLRKAKTALLNMLRVGADTGD